MAEKETSKADKTAKESVRISTICLVIIAFVAAAGALKYTQPVMVPFLLAMFIVSMVSPLLDRLVIKHKCPKPIAVTISLLLVLTVIMVICLVLISSTGSIISTADHYAKKFDLFSRDVSVDIEEFVRTKLNFENFNINELEITSQLSSKIPSLVSSTFGTAIGISSTVFFVVIFVIFMVAGRNPYIIHQGVMEDIDKNVRRYITTKLAVSFVTGVLVWLILKVIGLELAAVFGVLAFLMNFIPSIGSMIATLLPIPIAFAQFESGWMIFAAIAGPGIVQMMVGNVIEPKIMGQGLNLHPVTILLALSFWGLLWGVIGMFLAAPITAVMRIVFMQFETLRPLGNLMAGKLPSSQKADSGNLCKTV